MRHVGDHLAQRGGVAGHLQADVEAFAQAEFALAVGDGGAGDVQGEAGAELAGEVEAFLADVGDDDMAGAGVLGDGGGHQADGAGAGDQHVLVDEGEGQRGVHGVAERVEDRRDVQVDLDPVHPHIGGGQGYVLGERAVAADTEADGGTAQVTASGEAVAALAAHEVPLAADQVAGLDVGDVAAGVDDLADELVPDDEGVLMVCWAQPSQFRMCRSVPQIPVRSTLMRTSPGPTAGSGTSMSQSPGSAFCLTSAFTTTAPWRCVPGRGQAEAPRVRERSGIVQQSAARRPPGSIEVFLSAASAFLHTG
ncbi:hypothetical protein GCM10020256_07200 [Streptomyces thermocoprophilus]